jgi:hypothetical protein
MSRSNHAQMMGKLFKSLCVQTSKLTHELRIFAAQVMYEMGVSLEVSRPASLFSSRQPWDRGLVVHVRRCCVCPTSVAAHRPPDQQHGWAWHGLMQV